MTIAALILGILSSCNKVNDHTLPDEASFGPIIDSTNHLYDAGQQSRAIRYINSAVNDINTLSFGQKVEFYAIHYNYFFHIKQDNAKALYYSDILLQLSKKAPNKEDQAEVYSKACFYKGDALFKDNKYNEAYFFYYQGKLASSNSGKFKDCTLSDYSYRMGMILYKQEHYRAAADYFKRSFKESDDCELRFRTFYRRQELLNNVGISYNKINELDSALLFLNKALSYINNPPKKFNVADSLLDAARGVVYGNQASVYIKKGDHLNAKALLKKSIAINEQKGFDNNDALLSQLKLVHLYQDQKQPDSMLIVLKETQNQLNKVNNNAAEADWNLLMAGYYEHKGQLPASIRYFKIYDSVKTLATNKMLALKAYDITEQLKRFERDYEVNELKKNNHQKNVYLVVAILFFGMALVILLLIYLNWQKSKKLLTASGELNQQINIKNTDLKCALNKLEISHQEKDRILRTVAHDLRNPIGGIASLTGTVIDDDECTTEQQTYLT